MEVTVYVVNFFMGVYRTNEKSCLSRRTRDFGICKGNFFCLETVAGSFAKSIAMLIVICMLGKIHPSNLQLSPIFKDKLASKSDLHD